MMVLKKMVSIYCTVAFLFLFFCFFAENKPKKVKNLKKLCKKVLTRYKRCDIIVKLSAGAGSDRSLKIEQQEISTKQKASANLVERVIYTQTK